MNTPNEDYNFYDYTSDITSDDPMMGMNQDMTPDDITALEANAALSRILEKSDFSLLTPSDFYAVGNMPMTEEMSVQIEGNSMETVEIENGGFGSLFQRSGNLQTHDADIPLIGNLFEFRNCIGIGGFSYITRAFDIVLQREVAIKTLREEHNAIFSKRNAFVTEAMVTANLDHPNIIPIHGLYTDNDNRLHLVIKLIDGKNFREILIKTESACATMTRKELFKSERRRLVSHLEIFLKVCDAIGYAHNKKVLHRDLKPENVMVGLFNEVYVTDWGIAESRETKTQHKKGSVQGTPQYLAPEIISSYSYDSRSDIYSLGVMLFDLVYLKKPFPEKIKTDALFKQKLNGQTVPMKHAFGYKIPHTLAYIIRKAMRIQPAARYQTVQALADDLRRYLHGERVVESILGQVKKFFTAVFR